MTAIQQIQSGNTAENGEIIVALVEGHEATLKRLRRKGEMIALEAANASYETRIFRSDQIRVQAALLDLSVNIKFAVSRLGQTRASFASGVRVDARSHFFDIDKCGHKRHQTVSKIGPEHGWRANIA